MTTKSLRQIFTLALDIKVPEDGPIQILEFMGAHVAGYKGHAQVYSYDLFDDVILPYLRETFHVPAEQVGLITKDTPLSQIGYAYGHELAENNAGIIMPRKDFEEDTQDIALHITRSDLLFAQRNTNFSVVNADLQFLMMADNKAAQAYLIAEDKTLSEFSSPTHVAPTFYDPSLADRIISDLGPASRYVIKPIDQAQGNGVRIVTPSGLDKELSKILVDMRKGKLPRDGVNFWMSNILPAFIVQPYIPSRPVQRRFEDYDGTLRTFVTINRDPLTARWESEIHGAYWKLPLHPLHTTKARSEHLISHSPYRLESYGLKKKEGWQKPMPSKRISRAQADEIFPQVARYCERLPDVMQKDTLYTRTYRHLTSKDPAKQATGLTMALHGEYFPAEKDDTIPPSNYLYPRRLYSNIKRLALNDQFNGAHDRFVRSLMIPGMDNYFTNVQYYYGSPYYIPWAALSAFEFDEPFREKMNAKSPLGKIPAFRTDEV